MFPFATTFIPRFVSTISVFVVYWCVIRSRGPASDGPFTLFPFSFLLFVCFLGFFPHFGNARQRLGLRLSSTAFGLAIERAREDLWPPSNSRPFPKRQRTGALHALSDIPSHHSLGSALTDHGPLDTQSMLPTTATRLCWSEPGECGLAATAFEMLQTRIPGLDGY